MNDRIHAIENVVKEIYNNSILDNKEDVNYWIKIALDKYLDKNISIEEIRELIQKQVKRKQDISAIKTNHYDKYYLVNSIAESIGNIPQEHIEDILLENEEKLGLISSEELTEICVYSFKKYRKYDITIEHKVPKIIEKILYSEKTKKLLSKILLTEETISTHSLASVDGTYLMHNLSTLLEIIKFLTQYIIIHQEDYQMEELYEKLMNKNINLMNAEELKQYLNNLILSSIQQKLGLIEVESIESREKIAKFVWDNYIEKGYSLQGINGKYKNSVLINGLTSKFSQKEDSRLIILNKIFEKHGLDKIFFSKLDETKIAPYYYLTDNMATAYHYSYHNPEWFSYFCATGNNMPDFKYNRVAYYLRDFDGCLENISKLCDHYKLTLQEKNYVISFFNDYWNQIVNDNNDNTIVFIPRTLINRNKIDFDFSTISEKSAIDIIEEVISSQYNIDKQFYDIPKECIHVIDAPKISRFFDKEYMGKLSPKKIILENGETLNYDILINADNMSIDCISLVDTTKPIMKSEKSIYGNNINIIYCSNEIKNTSLMDYDTGLFQTLEMLIAVNGISNSEKGQAFINKIRNNYSPEYMSNYYYYLANMFCEIALNEKISPQQRASLLVRVIKELYPKAELMRKTNDYPQYIDDDKKVFSYLDYRGRLLLERIENIKNNSELNDPEALTQLAQLFKNKMLGKLNHEFMKEFDIQMQFFANQYYNFNQNVFSEYENDDENPEQDTPKR